MMHTARFDPAGSTTSGFMGFREQLGKHPQLFQFAAIAVTLGSLLAIFLQSRPARPPVVKAYFTTDDGKTLFVDTLDRVPPFDRDGKPAVMAYVFTCDDGATRWVAYLSKYSDKDRQTIISGSLGDANVRPPRLVKLPGSANWQSESDRNVMASLIPHCPDGQSSETIRPVNP